MASASSPAAIATMSTSWRQMLRACSWASAGLILSTMISSHPLRSANSLAVTTKLS
jgi:hypothetical protein